MHCQSCQQAAPLAQATFRWNIGLLVIRFQGADGGLLCRSCVASKFWTAFAINVTLGWWGIISFFLTPILLIMNVVAYSSAQYVDFGAPDEAYNFYGDSHAGYGAYDGHSAYGESPQASLPTSQNGPRA